jgi:hypothetical protein
MRKAALKVSRAADEPNLILPLASSINERGIAGFTHSITNSEDQRKVNCFYELAKNPMTGKGTLTLAKRPGVTINSNTYGSSSQISSIITRVGSMQDGTNLPWVFSTLSGDIRVSSSASTTVILAATPSLNPTFVDHTTISGVDTIVVQLRESNINTKHRVFFASAIGAWTEITDADFTAIFHKGKMEHMDGFAFILGNDNNIWSSDTNSLANWTATSFLAKQIRQDAPVGLARLNNQILAFGDETVESFYNAGNTTGSPLLPLRHLHQKIGMHMTQQNHYYAIIEGSIFFVGRRSGGFYSRGVFAYNGQTVEKISTPYIDKIIGEATIDSVYSFGFNGHKAVSIGISNVNASTQRWLMFFPDYKEWFEWTSTVFRPTNASEYFLGMVMNKVYIFSSSDNWQDDGTSYPWSTQFKLPTNGSSRKFMQMYGVDADTDTTTNDLTAEISTDDCATFSTLGTIPLNQDRKVLFRGGSFRKLHVRLGNTNARPVRIHNFLARLE